MSQVFHRSPSPILAIRANGCWVYDDNGRAYLDAAGGAIVSNIGHGDTEVMAALAAQAGVVDYVHASTFTTPALEEYATALAPFLPMADPKLFPTSGGSEAVETAFKMARTYHQARGEDQRDLILSREMSYHGNTIGALDAGGRQPLRRPYLSWLGRWPKVAAVNEYRCPAPGHPNRCAEWHVERTEEAFDRAGPNRVAAFIGEPIGGATLGATTPPEGYWPAIAEVCRRHGALLIVDEVMTGFGRTGTWFGIDHYGARPDILVAAKGAASGYWPLGLTVASGEVHQTVVGSFVHGFTFSHFPIGASVASAVLDRLVERRLVEAVADKGRRLLHSLRKRVLGLPGVGDVRGIGLLIAIEMVADKDSKRPYPRSMRIAETVTGAARRRDLLVYPSTGGADGVDGDLVLLGPPFIITDDEMAMVVTRLAGALEEVLA
jgi:adenosylmethionine-8-amino-7-oxononanoate aminotransferase